MRWEWTGAGARYSLQHNAARSSIDRCAFHFSKTANESRQHARTSRGAAQLGFQVEILDSGQRGTITVGLSAKPVYATVSVSSPSPFCFGSPVSLCVARLSYKRNVWVGRPSR